MPRKTIEKTYTEGDIRNAIWFLEHQGATKKYVCENILKITYNTKKLDTIIADFKTKLETQEKLKLEARSKELSDFDKKNIIKDYLNGASISALAAERYLTSPRIKKVLIEGNIPLRGRGKHTPGKTEHVIQDLDRKLKVGERVFYSKKNRMMIVHKVYDEEYVEYLKDTTERFVRIHEPSPNKLDTEGVHYEQYYILKNGEEIKRGALEHMISTVEKVLEETGREFYRVWDGKDDEDANTKEYGSFYDVKRKDLFPVEIN